MRSALLAGGRVVGASSADGGEVRERRVEIDDLQATICHLLGLNARKRIYSTGQPTDLDYRTSRRPPR